MLLRVAADREAAVLSLERFQPEGWDDGDDVVDLLFSPGLREVEESEADVVAQRLVAGGGDGELPEDAALPDPEANAASA